MAKRKFGASIIILCIAAVTLISGTYAWFLVGGFAELFDIGFDVMQAGAGVLVRGDNLTYGGGKRDNNGWGDNLQRDDFKTGSFIKQGNRYVPISTKNAEDFLFVVMENDKFVCDGAVITKRVPGAQEDDIVFNDFTLSIKSAGEEIPGGENGPYMTIRLSGDSYDDEGNRVKNENDRGAAIAARAAVTIDGVTTIYSIDGEEYNAVTTAFPDNTIYDYRDPNPAPNESGYNYIIDSKDEGYTAAGLTPIERHALIAKTETVNGKEVDTLFHIPLGTIPNKDSMTGKEITVRIWLEGNDPDCISFGDGAVAGKSLMADIQFYAE